MTEKSEGKTPLHLKIQSWMHHVYHRFCNTVRKSAMKIFSSSALMFIILCVLVLLLVSFVSVMFSETVKEGIGPLLGLSEKNEILTYLGIGMGALLVSLQALMSYRRANAMEETANAQIKAAEQQAIANQNAQLALQQERQRTEETAYAQARANQNTENGLRQERLKNAIEHLGNDSDSVRLGGAYELFHLAQDTKKEALQRMYGSVGADERFHLAQDTPDLSQTVLDILCAHIRRTTGEDEYRKTHQSKPSEEVQSLLTLLFVQDHDVFKGLLINLQESWLNGADLMEARLSEAFMNKVYLQGAFLEEAQLREASLDEVRMQRATLEGAELQRASLEKAQLQEADLNHARLQGAYLEGAQMQAVNLEGAHMPAADLNHGNLQGANLLEVRLQGANLSEASLQGTDLEGTQLQGASLERADFRGAGTGDWSSSETFAERVRESVGKKNNFSSTVFFGGIDRKLLDSLAEGLSDEKARSLREILSPHMDPGFAIFQRAHTGFLGAHTGSPSNHTIPENSDAITGAYTKKEAEKWIAEYEKAMSEVPTNDR